MRFPTESRVFRIRPRVSERHTSPADYVRKTKDRIKLLADLLREAPQDLDRKAIGAGIWFASRELGPRGVVVRVTLDAGDWAVLDDMAKRLGAPSTPRFIENTLACWDTVMADVALRRTMTPEEIADLEELEDLEAAAKAERDDILDWLDEEEGE